MKALLCSCIIFAVICPVAVDAGCCLKIDNFIFEQRNQSELDVEIVFVVDNCAGKRFYTGFYRVECVGDNRPNPIIRKGFACGAVKEREPYSVLSHTRVFLFEKEETKRINIVECVVFLTDREGNKIPAESRKYKLNLK